MTFEDFVDHCSFDHINEGDKTKILVIFSEGMTREFGTEFVKAQTELAEDLVASDLYDYIKEQMKNE